MILYHKYRKFAEYKKIFWPSQKWQWISKWRFKMAGSQTSLLKSFQWETNNYRKLKEHSILFIIIFIIIIIINVFHPVQIAYTVPKTSSYKFSLQISSLYFYLIFFFKHHHQSRKVKKCSLMSTLDQHVNLIYFIFQGPVKRVKDKVWGK